MPTTPRCLKRLFPGIQKRNDDWAVNNFCQWLTQRNKAHPDHLCPESLLEKRPWSVKHLSFWLARYACETRSKVSAKYPASTVFALLAGLLRYMQRIDAECPNFLDVKNPEFKEIHAVINTYFRQLRESGVGTETKHTPIITKEEENCLWDQGVIGVETPESLLRAVFYYNGKNFCLHRGSEHRALKVSQLVRHTEPDRYVYTENGSKNRSGGLWQMRVENKVTPIIAKPELGVRCHVSLLDKYVSKLPPKAHEIDCFYMKPFSSQSVAADSSKPWFASQPCGVNKLSLMIKDMFAMVDGKTNHSLRATGASEMFRAGVLEKIAQERTGHRSVKAL